MPTTIRLGTGPNTIRPDTFDVESDTFLPKLEPWGDEVAAIGDAATVSATTAATAASSAATQATAAASSAAAAAASAATAVNAPGTSAASTTSATIALGSTTITIQTGKLFSVGQQIVIASTAAPLNWMAGTITTHNSGTGSLTVNTTNISGSGTLAAWTVSLSGAPGFTGVVNELKGANIASAATINLDTATGNLIHVTGTTTITAITLATGAERTVIFDGALTLTHGAVLLLPSAANITTAANDRMIVRGDAAGAIVVSYTKVDGQAVVALGSGGASASANVALTAASAGAMTVAPTAIGMYMTLPDATTCAKGIALFAAFNASDYDYGIKDSTGIPLGWIRPRSQATFGLSDSSTAAGVWLLSGVEKMAITASLSNVNITSSMVRALAIDATRTMLFDPTSTYAVVFDSISQSFGSVTLLRGTVSQSYAILSAANQVLFVSCTTSTSAMQAVVLTISGTSIGLGTAASVTLGGNFLAPSIPGIIAVGASWCVGYMRDTTTMGVRAISILGTTPTIGAESALASTRMAQQPLLFASGSILRTVCGDSTSALLMTVKPFTVSGSTLTPGTAATITFDGADAIYAVVNGQGRLVLMYPGPSAQYWNTTMATLSGTTETLTTTLSLGFFAAGLPEFVPVGTNKILLSSSNPSTPGTCLHIDTAGMQSISTVIPQYGAIYAVSGTTAKIYDATRGLVSVDCSGATPVAGSSVTVASKYGSVSSISAMSNGVRNPGTLLKGATAYTATTGSNLYIPGNVPYATIPFLGTGFSVNAQIPGSSDGWISSVSLLQHVECAA